MNNNHLQHGGSGRSPSPENGSDNFNRNRDQQSPVRRSPIRQNRHRPSRNISGVSPMLKRQNSTNLGSRKVALDSGLITPLFLLALICLSAVLHTKRNNPTDFGGSDEKNQLQRQRMAEAIAAQRMRTLHATLASMDDASRGVVAVPLRVNMLLTEQQQQQTTRQRSPSPVEQRQQHVRTVQQAIGVVQQQAQPVRVVHYQQQQATMEPESGITTNVDQQHNNNNNNNWYEGVETSSTTMDADDPSLMDYDAIDAYWRMDIEQEKGNNPIYYDHEQTIQASNGHEFGPEPEHYGEQGQLLFERDIQLLTEKSLFFPTGGMEQHFDDGVFEPQNADQKWEMMPEMMLEQTSDGDELKVNELWNDGHKTELWWQTADLGFNEDEQYHQQLMDGIPLFDDHPEASSTSMTEQKYAVVDHPPQPFAAGHQLEDDTIMRTPSPFPQFNELFNNNAEEHGDDQQEEEELLGVMPRLEMDEEMNSATEAILSDMAAALPLLTTHFGHENQESSSLEPILEQLNRTTLMGNSDVPSCSSSLANNALSQSTVDQCSSVRCSSTTSSGFGSFTGNNDEDGDGLSLASSSAATLIWNGNEEEEEDEWSNGATSASGMAPGSSSALSSSHHSYRTDGKLVPKKMRGKGNKKKRCSKYDYERELAEKLEQKWEAEQYQDEEEREAIRSISKQSSSSTPKSSTSKLHQKQKSKRGRKSKDNSIALELGLPYSAEQLTAMPYAQYSALMRDGGLSAQQKAMVKKIRRRGRNKLAAEKCRHRRMQDRDGEEEEEDESIKEEVEEGEEQTPQMLNPSDISLFPIATRSSSTARTRRPRVAAAPAAVQPRPSPPVPAAIDDHQQQRRREAYSEFVRAAIRVQV